MCLGLNEMISGVYKVLPRFPKLLSDLTTDFPLHSRHAMQKLMIGFIEFFPQDSSLRLFLLLQAVHYFLNCLLIDIEILAFGDLHQIRIKAVVGSGKVLTKLFSVLSVNLLSNHLPD